MREWCQCSGRKRRGETARIPQANQCVRYSTDLPPRHFSALGRSLRTCPGRTMEARGRGRRTKNPAMVDETPDDGIAGGIQKHSSAVDVATHVVSRFEQQPGGRGEGGAMGLLQTFSQRHAKGTANALTPLTCLHACTLAPLHPYTLAPLHPCTLAHYVLHP